MESLIVVAAIIMLGKKEVLIETEPTKKDPVKASAETEKENNSNRSRIISCYKDDDRKQIKKTRRLQH